MTRSHLTLLAAVAAQVLLTTTPSMAYRYYHPTGSGNPDVSWLPLGNGRGHLLATENPVGLPIISVLRSPASGKTVINGQNQLRYDYVNGDVLTLFNSKRNYGPSQVDFQDGMQPVVCYDTGAGQQVVWPMLMNAVSRQWVENANVLRTVMGTADFELTVDDFMATDRDMLVRILTVKNLRATAQSYRLMHFAPICPSGRDNTPWSTNWLTMASTNYASYDNTSDYLLFRDGTTNWWVVGADTRSSGHNCGAQNAVYADIADGALSGGAGAGPGVVEGAHSFDSPSLATGASFSVTMYVANLTANSSADAVTQFTNNYKNSSGSALQTAALGFWRNWLAVGTSGQIADAATRTFTQRVLTVLKACCWDIGGISAVPGELSPFYTRDGMPPARAFALFGHWNEARKIVLALEGYMTLSGNMNFQSYNSTVGTLVNAGFTESTTFTNITSFSADDPAIVTFTAGELWEISGRTDTAFIRQTWPLMKHMISLGERDMTSLGVIGQNGGFQDDMMHWAFERTGTGIECSFINMMWVAALERAAQVGTTLGHTTDASHFTALAASIRANIESKFWSDAQNQYAYIHVPDGRDLGRTDFVAVADGAGGRYIFPNTPIQIGLGCPWFYGYATDTHAQRCLSLIKSTIEPLPVADPIMSNMGRATEQLTMLLYSKAAASDATMDTTKNWFVRNMPLAGIPESYAGVGNRAVQVWMCGETLCGIYAWLEANGGTAVAPRSADRTLQAASAPWSIVRPATTFDLTGRLVGLPSLRQMAGGVYVRVLGKSAPTRVTTGLR